MFPLRASSLEMLRSLLQGAAGLAENFKGRNGDKAMRTESIVLLFLYSWKSACWFREYKIAVVGLGFFFIGNDTKKLSCKSFSMVGLLIRRFSSISDRRSFFLVSDFIWFHRGPRTKLRWSPSHLHKSFVYPSN